jgi:hypothetical protein
MDAQLWEQARATVYPRYKKPSAYRSMALVKEYKRLGGTYDSKHRGTLKRWMDEEWKDVGPQRGSVYPVFRPTKRITKDTPLTVDEVDPADLQRQIVRKQRIQGSRNLQPFLPRPEDMELLGFESSTRKGKKVDAILRHKITGRMRRIPFGQKGSTTFHDLTGVGGDPVHGDSARRQRYRQRHAGEGDAHRMYSPGWWSWHVLW